MWEYVTDPQNREVLGWLGGGLVVLAGGAWAVFKYFHRPGGPEKASPTVSADHGIAAGRDFKARDVDFSASGKPSKPRD